LASSPRVLPYYNGAPTPPGYTFQSRPRWGLVIPGAFIFTIGYGIALLALTSPQYDDRFWLAVPVLGPGARVFAKEEDNGLEWVCLFFQAPGAAMMAAGLISPTKRFVRNDLAGIRFTPLAMRGGAGIRAFGEF